MQQLNTTTKISHNSLKLYEKYKSKSVSSIMLIAANAKSSTHQHNNKKQHHNFSLTARITTIVVIEKNHNKIKICYKEQNILQYNINQVKGSKRSSKKKKKITERVS